MLTRRGKEDDCGLSAPALPARCCARGVDAKRWRAYRRLADAPCMSTSMSKATPTDDRLVHKRRKHACAQDIAIPADNKSQEGETDVPPVTQRPQLYLGRHGLAQEIGWVNVRDPPA